MNPDDIAFAGLVVGGLAAILAVLIWLVQRRDARTDAAAAANAEAVRAAEERARAERARRIDSVKHAFMQLRTAQGADVNVGTLIEAGVCSLGADDEVREVVRWIRDGVGRSRPDFEAFADAPVDLVRVFRLASRDPMTFSAGSAKGLIARAAENQQ